MRILVFILLFISYSQVVAARPEGGSNPLCSFSAQWNDAKYNACNTAANARYMSSEEKKVIFILNMARTNPRLFRQTVLSKITTFDGFVDTTSVVYYRSLIALMDTMKPLGLLYPDSLCFRSARAHAMVSGKKGYVGHDRQDAESRKAKHFMGECCSYGMTAPLTIVAQLLVDQDVPSLGHREICLGYYSKIAVSIQPHKQYGSMAVLDLY